MPKLPLNQRSFTVVQQWSDRGNTKICHKCNKNVTKAPYIRLRGTFPIVLHMECSDELDWINKTGDSCDPCPMIPL